MHAKLLYKCNSCMSSLFSIFILSSIIICFFLHPYLFFPVSCELYIFFPAARKKNPMNQKNPINKKKNRAPLTFISWCDSSSHKYYFILPLPELLRFHFLRPSESLPHNRRSHQNHQTSARHPH